MVTLGLFDGKRAELIEGEVLEMAPQLEPHAVAVGLADQLVRAIFGKGYVVRVQCPLSLGGNSEPEPDIAIVAGEPRDYLKRHPDSPLLVIEVAASTLSHDRGRKALVYAAAAIQDYWIVNLKDRQVEVLRQPQRKSARRAPTYTDRTTYLEGDSLTALAAPKAKIRVADLLP